jgi:hypothetical protein
VVLETIHYPANHEIHIFGILSYFFNPNWRIYIIKRLLWYNKLHEETKIPVGGVQKLSPYCIELSSTKFIIIFTTVPI